MHMVKEIQGCIQLIPEVKFKKVRGEYNALAHELAQLATLIDYTSTLFLKKKELLFPSS